MTTHDPLLETLYAASRDAQEHALAARSAPVLYFDAREPFLPLAAGYTIFQQDSPSDSFDRVIELRPEDRPPAATAIEYAIWWDWDIHHLYELEHVWVYLDRDGTPVRVEGSWHGKLYEHPLQLKEERPVLLSEPGKHAFAPHPSWFEKRQREFRRPETQAVSAHASVLVNHLFAGKIRQRVFDRVLVRAFLNRHAFTPAWQFTRRFTFPARSLVPWRTLAAWIPRRVNAILEHLEAVTPAEAYRGLRLVSARGDLEGLQAAAHTGADAVHLKLALHGARLAPDGSDGVLDLEDIFQFLYRVPMGAFLELTDIQAVDPLAWFVRSKNLGGHAAVLSADRALLAMYSAYVPGSVTALQLEDPGEDPVTAAQEARSAFVFPRWAGSGDRLTSDWINRVHQAGLGIIGWPAGSASEAETQHRLGLDVVWENHIETPPPGRSAPNQEEA